MSMVVWIMMGIAIWHFAVFVPDRFWGGIVGAFLAAIAGAALFGFAVSGFTNDNGDLRLDWNSLPGVSYDVQTSTDMIHWNSEAESIRARGTSSSAFIAPTPEDAARFWRIRQNP